ncbi:MAG TPA: hypothetical protein VND93_05425 [Myxococcales bacterium]|nr:hypothetical protein [Myxococcales bacterium]
MTPPHPGPFRECRHLFARGQCRFHERARRSRELPEVVNFGGGTNPHLVRPAWVDAAPRTARPPPSPWSALRARLEAACRAIAAWLRAAAAEPGLASPWMASEAIAGGEPPWPGP